MSAEKKICIDPATEVNYKTVETIIGEWGELPAARYKKLERYYRGMHDILARTTDKDKPNNKIVANYAKFITDVMTGYFMGIPVTYDAEKANKEKLQRLFDVLDENFEEDVNYQLAKEASIAGKAYELVYRDANAHLKFKKVPYTSVIPVYSDEIDEELLFVLRLYKKRNIEDGKEIEYVDVYTDKDIITFNRQSKEDPEVKPHNMGHVPIIEYKNNDEGMGDFEVVLSSIDAYNKAQSDTANDFEYFTDAFLVLVGMGGTTPEDAQKLKEERILLLKEQGQAQWLTKNINDAATENYKNRLQDDIHRISQTPDLTDEKFAGNVSGEAMKYKLWGLEQVASIKERKFQTGLLKRLSIIAYDLRIRDKSFTYQDVTLNFHRNIPQNVVEMVDVVDKLGDIVSQHTKLSMLPNIDDVDAEVERVEEEKQKRDQSQRDLFNQTYIDGQNQI